MDIFDLLVVGGGPAGIMAAMTAKRKNPGMSVAIADRTHELGRKFLTSGAGRGNLTNIRLDEGPGMHYHGNKTFISAVFDRYGFRQIMDFFDTLGVKTYEEIKSGRGKIFPSIDHARTIRDLMVAVLSEMGIEIIVNTPVSTLQRTAEAWKAMHAAGSLYARNVILSSGGKTYPSLGSDGSGYDIAQSLGHTIIDPVPSAVPVVSKNILSHFLQGEKTVMRAQALIDGVSVSQAVGDVMFTQYGFSGPAVFDISREFSIQLNRHHKQGCSILLQFFPDMDTDAIRKEVTDRLSAHPSFLVSQCLWGLLTAKSAAGVCAASKLPKELTAGMISKDQTEELIHTLSAFVAPVTATRGWNEAEFTAGGVNTDEVNPQSMESLRAQGVYVTGEILDVDGDVGGFNLSWAWATGYIAGVAVADEVIKNKSIS